MARIRSIKPELPQDARLAKASREARYTFILLLTQADDQGYFRASPRLLLGQLFPHDTDVTESVLVGWLDELRKLGLLTALDSDDGPLGHIVNFLKHQKIDHPSKIYLARCSRKARDSFAKGVLSLDLTTTPQPPLAAAPPVAVAVPEKQQLPEEAVGAFYGRCLKRLLWVRPHPDAVTQHNAESSDVNILKRPLRAVARHEIMLAVREVRLQADAGLLAGWIGRGENFSLKVLVSGNTGGGITFFERFRHEGMKREEANGKGERSTLTPVAASVLNGEFLS